MTGECDGGELAGGAEVDFEGPGSGWVSSCLECNGEGAKRTREKLSKDLDRGSGSIEGERGKREPGIVMDFCRLRPGLGSGGGPITSRTG